MILARTMGARSYDLGLERKWLIASLLSLHSEGIDGEIIDKNPGIE